MGRTTSVRNVVGCQKAKRIGGKSNGGKSNYLAPAAKHLRPVVTKDKIDNNLKKYNENGFPAVAQLGNKPMHGRGHRVVTGSRLVIRHRVSSYLQLALHVTIFITPSLQTTSLECSVCSQEADRSKIQNSSKIAPPKF